MVPPPGTVESTSAFLAISDCFCLPSGAPGRFLLPLAAPRCLSLFPAVHGQHKLQVTGSCRS